ncbi:hypothetical protein [Companilactobacillus furfuricola]|uniref:hypothetical protein n=1 Tax=Companilactobacillus furfuricola TaxID=1462575 RepID=UPI0013DDCBC7|nr:hypothetical protein [Companilactobacillus furfuricola]
MVVTDTNGDSQSHTGEILQLKTPSEVIDGESGSFSIKIDGLEPNKAYENMFSIRWYNPDSQLVSEYVDVPSFTTLMAKPVDIDPNEILIEWIADGFRAQDNTSRDPGAEKSHFIMYEISTDKIVSEKDYYRVWVEPKDKTPGTTYENTWGVYWRNATGESNRVVLKGLTVPEQ